MMYQEKMAVAIKVGGRVLREFKETVYIPFGSEYAFFIKNMNNRRAVVHISIDGDDVTDGGIIVDANSAVDLERFIRNGNLSSGNRFKFIERTAAIEQHRGIKAEDGLIRIEFEYEREDQTWKNVYKPYNWENIRLGKCRGGDMMRGAIAKGGPDLADNWSYTSTAAFDSAIGGAMSASAGGATLDCYMAQNAAAPTVKNDAGITVSGSESKQQFTTVYDFVGEGKSHVMIFKLLGETGDNKPVVEPVTVKAKPKCSTCGIVNIATAKFCRECGTALEIL